jgi:hypothetical protein
MCAVGLAAVAAAVARGSSVLWIALLIVAALVFVLFYVALAVGMSPRNEVAPEIVEELTNLGGQVRNKQRVDVTLMDGRTRQDVGFAYHRDRELSFGRRRYRGWRASDAREVRPTQPH